MRQRTHEALPHGNETRGAHLSEQAGLESPTISPPVEVTVVTRVEHLHSQLMADVRAQPRPVQNTFAACGDRGAEPVAVWLLGRSDVEQSRPSQETFANSGTGTSMQPDMSSGQSPTPVTIDQTLSVSTSTKNNSDAVCPPESSLTSTLFGAPSP